MAALLRDSRCRDRVGEPNSHGQTALSLARLSGQTQVIEVLLDSGSDAGALDPRGFPLLHEVVAQSGEAKYLDLLKSLLGRSDVDVNAPASAKAHGGKTALHLAVEMKMVEAAQLLLASPSIKVKARDQFGRTARWYTPWNSDLAQVLKKAEESGAR